jgi:uncharacterized protein involved in response to NO
MSGWQTLRTRYDPLLWSLHLGYAWVVIGLFATALADLTGAIPWSVGLHAETSGAIGTMVLAVMTRVVLGHTGRPLAAPRAATIACLLVSAAALVRTVGALVFPDPYLHVIALAALLWAAAYAVFLVHYAPMLLRRVWTDSRASRSFARPPGRGGVALLRAPRARRRRGRCRRQLEDRRA